MEKDKGVKYDKRKLRLDLLPFDALMGIATTLTMGAVKYEDRNWEQGLTFSRVMRALLGHILAWWMGVEIDAETGLKHIDQVGVNAVMLSHFAKDPEKYQEFDDRPEGADKIYNNIMSIVEDNFDEWVKKFSK